MLTRTVIVHLTTRGRHCFDSLIVVAHAVFVKSTQKSFLSESEDVNPQATLNTFYVFLTFILDHFVCISIAYIPFLLNFNLSSHIMSLIQCYVPLTLFPSIPLSLQHKIMHSMSSGFHSVVLDVFLKFVLFFTRYGKSPVFWPDRCYFPLCSVCLMITPKPKPKVYI